MKQLKIHALDNVAVDIESGHKIALKDIPQGSNVIKFGFPIGHATEDIKAGESVHTHNVKTNLGEKLTYTYEPVQYELPRAEESTINVYVLNSAILKFSYKLTNNSAYKQIIIVPLYV